MEANINALANHKRDEGKTASVASIGAILAWGGKNVLPVDTDTQSNLIPHPYRIYFFNIYEKGPSIANAIEVDVRAKYGDRVYTVIRKNNNVSKVAFDFTDVVSFNRREMVHRISISLLQ